GRMGQPEIADYKAALEQLARRHSFIDSTRVGIMGSSWGGYMTVRAIVTEPDTYHAAVAIYPFGDLWSNAAGSIEPYMGAVETNPDGYDEASVMDRLHQ